MKHLRLFSLFITMLFLFNLESRACTTLSISDGETAYVAKSYDFTTGTGAAYINKRNVEKSAFVHPGDNPAKWTSKYASLTFNPWGQELAASGVNEKGLVVEVMWLQNSSYTIFPADNVVGELQWVQYQLDNYSTVGEMIENADKITVKSLLSWQHYMACDRTGACATFDFINGGLEIHKDLPYKALSNKVYRRSVDGLSNYQGFGGTKNIPKGNTPFARFVRAAYFADNYSSDQEPVEYLNGALKSLRHGRFTKWNIIYNTKTLDVSFRQTNGDTSILNFNLNDYDASCSKEAVVWDLDGTTLGDRLPHPYSAELNGKFVARAYKEMPFSRLRISPAQVEQLKKHPQSFKCNE